MPPPAASRKPARHSRGGHGPGEGGDGGAKADQCGGVVDQRFTFKDADDPAGHAHFPGDGGCSDGIRWCHDGAQGDRGRQWNFREEPPDDGPDSEGAENDVSDREQANGTAVGPEIEDRGPEGRGVQQRREQPYQDKFGVQFNRGDERQERPHDAGQHQQQRNRNIDFPAECAAGTHHGYEHKQS